jgi:hypothetical protein
MVLSDDAVGLEIHLPHQLADRRLDLVNMRREFFRARPADVRDILARLDASIVRWVDEPEALEWRQSQQTRRQQDALVLRDARHDHLPPPILSTARATTNTGHLDVKSRKWDSSWLGGERPAARCPL